MVTRNNNIASVMTSFCMQPQFGVTLLHVLFNARKLSAAYRRTALRVCSALRAVWADAVFVNSGMMPTDILADQMASIYNVKPISPLSKVKNPKGRNLYENDKCDVTPHKRVDGTHRLIPGIAEGLETWTQLTYPSGSRRKLAVKCYHRKILSREC